MLTSACFLWDTGICPLYTYSSIFIIILLAWQVTRSYRGWKLEPKRSCGQRHRKVRQRARDAASTARRLAREEAEKPWELLSFMKSQNWLPKEGSIRQFLCVDPCCHICDAAALEIQQLLESEKSQVSPALLGLPQDSSGLEMVPVSSVSFEQNIELHSRHPIDFSLVPVTPTLTQLTGHLTQMTSVVNVHEYWADHFQLGPEFRLTDMPMVSETMASLRPEEPVVLVMDEDIMQNKPKPNQENQDPHQLKSSVPFLPSKSEIINLTHDMSLHMNSVLPAHLPLLSPKTRRLLEVHLKKWIHFQKWGLPRRVEESLKQLMPDPKLFCRSRKNQLSSILNSTSKVTIDKTQTISQQTKGSCLAGHSTQTCWVSEWSVINVEQINHWNQIQTYNALSSQEIEPLSDFYLIREAQDKDSGSNCQKKYNQLFCGLPSLHSESLASTFLGSQGVSKNTSKPTSQDPLLLKKFSIPFLPKTPLKSALPSPSASPSDKSSYDEYEGAQIDVPFLTLDECEALECHLLQRQVKLQWGLPVVFLSTRSTQVQSELHDKDQTPKTVKTFWPTKPFSLLTRELCFPEHARRLLEFHLQKQLTHLRWGLPQRIQQSIHLLLSSAEQQPLSCSRGALPSVSISQPGRLKADGSGGMFLPTVGNGSIYMSHLFAKAKMILQSHIDSKCGQIHQGKVPAHVCSSWECGIPGDLAARSPFPSTPQGKRQKLQAENKPDLHHKIMPWMPKTLDQEKQAFPDALTEHCKRPQSLPEETIKKLETTLEHKHLDFLSGLPAPYCVALSRSTSAVVTSQSRISEMKLSKPGKVPQEPLAQKVSLESPCKRLASCIQDDNKDSADTVEKSQPKVQVEGMTEKTPPESQTQLASPCSNVQMLAKLNFHMNKKVLEMEFGISEKEKQLKEKTATSSESKSKQESLKSYNKGSTVLQKPPTSQDYPPTTWDAKRVHGEEQATELEAVDHKQNQPSSKSVSLGSGQCASKVSQFSRDFTEAQEVCVDVEANRENPNLEEPFSTEPQSPDKSKNSAHVPTLTKKREAPGKPKAAENIEEGDAGLAFPQTNGKGYHAGGQRPERRPLGNTQQRPSFRLAALCPQSLQHPPRPKFPDPPPDVVGRKESERHMQDSETKVNVTLKPARIPEIIQPMVSQASKSHPFLRPPGQGKPVRSQILQDQVLQGPVMSAAPHKNSSLPEVGLRNTMKSFLHSINPKMKGKTHTETVFSTAGRMGKTTKENVEKSLAQVKSPTKNTKTENSGGPRPQSAPLRSQQAF